MDEERLEEGISLEEAEKMGLYPDHVDEEGLVEGISLEEAEKMGLSQDQISLYEGNDLLDDNVEERLAEIIYRFLNEESNSMPTPEFVAKVRSEATGEVEYGGFSDKYSSKVLISRGYGVEVTKDMIIRISRMENPGEKYIITPDEYFRLTDANKREEILVEKDNEGGYDLGRVHALQNILAKTNEIENEKQR